MVVSLTVIPLTPEISPFGGSQECARQLLDVLGLQGAKIRDSMNRAVCPGQLGLIVTKEG